MNQERIRQIAADIRVAEHFDMDIFWFKHPIPAECGTPACIAGFVCARYASESPAWKAALLDKPISNTADIAQQILDLDDLDAEQLFAPEGLFDGRVEYTRDMAVATLERLADTGEVDWQTEE